MMVPCLNLDQLRSANEAWIADYDATSGDAKPKRVVRVGPDLWTDGVESFSGQKYPLYAAPSLAVYAWRHLNFSHLWRKR